MAIGARVVSAEGKRIQVVDDDGKVKAAMCKALIQLRNLDRRRDEARRVATLSLSRVFIIVKMRR